ncbi:tripartite tricarboxylate transporter TctB family protein [Alteribacillus iranensis]|uniref:Tripartite tricarboxylate transporter TctB family protein n=1 Tax=Alteribacillus iranensis TaxID=930128 RepID=A0A1I2BEN2_9BACI|nr:tripartite tricarboxylate transporter TctB family protein [Alteribacillus iranensis]SFE53610.1 Tripartite tricarboxylate transporter TctB family protein [Alteribacillus iranensis]
MRIIFSVFLFLFSIYFTVQAYEYDYMTSSGQFGPGFFPLWIGFLLIVFTAITLFKAIKQRLEQEDLKSNQLTTLFLVFAVTFLFIFLLNILGAVIGMVIYVFALLFILNREKLVLNTIISITIPVGTYLLLDVWLNAGFPKGIFGL